VWAAATALAATLETLRAWRFCSHVSRRAVPMRRSAAGVC